MNIFLRELKTNFKSLVIWALIVIFFAVIGFAKFSAYYGNPELLAILNDMPAALVDALNMNAFNLTTVTGFFGVMFTYFALIVSIAAAMWGSDIISKEERDKTVEFSLTLPVTRSRVVTAKFLAALVNCVVLLFVSWGAILYGASSYHQESSFQSYVALSMLALFIMELIFLAVGIFLGCAMKQYKRAGSIAVSLLLGTYILSVMAGLSKNLDFLQYFTPFSYFNPANILRDSSLDLTYVLMSVGIIAAAMVGAYLTYNRRDLYI
ncbi:MAG: ABC transporter permease subunit [Anaerolineales bacterium]|jgi:ABC-2 type transport system permease protein